jgi:hypothetical protein
VPWNELLCGFSHVVDTALQVLLQLLHMSRIFVADSFQNLPQLLVAAGVAQVLVVGFESFGFLVQDGDQVKGKVVERKIALCDAFSCMWV